MAATTGMSARTGRALSADDHLRQSIGRILFTPIGSRVMRRDFGSYVAELIDQPLNAVSIQRIYGAAAIALRRWEPRVRLRRIVLQLDAAGAAFLHLTLERIGAAVDERTRISLPLRAS